MAWLASVVVTKAPAQGKPPLGANFTKLWTANAFTNVGDGIALAAGPLLVASLTDSPTLVAGSVFVQQLPFVLFALVSGAYVDRLDRRRLIIATNLARGLVIGGLAVAIWMDVVSIPVVYVAFFLVGTAETLADNASQALVPTVVSNEALPRANARLVGLHLVTNQLVAPPLGSALFVVAVAMPFGVNAVAFALAAVLMTRVRVAVFAPPERRPLWTEIGEGWRWLWGHKVIRMLAVSIFGMNVTLLAAFAILVLYARERLGLAEAGFGLLLAAVAVGGLLGSLLVTRLRRYFRDSVLLRTGLVIETVTHVVLALTETPWVAGGTLVVFGMHGAIWGVVGMTWRHRVVPEHLRGRVGSVHLMFSVGGAALGSLASGPIAEGFGITAPFWTSAAIMALLTAVAWRTFARHLVDTPA